MVRNQTANLEVSKPCEFDPHTLCKTKRKNMKRPDLCTNEMLEFLNKLCKSKKVNMYGSSVNLNQKFHLGTQALEIVDYWFESRRKDLK